MSTLHAQDWESRLGPVRLLTKIEYRLPHPHTMPVTISTHSHTSHTLTGPTLDVPSGLHRVPEGLFGHLGSHTPHTAVGYI